MSFAGLALIRGKPGEWRVTRGPEETFARTPAPRKLVKCEVNAIWRKLSLEMLHYDINESRARKILHAVIMDDVFADAAELRAPLFLGKEWMSKAWARDKI